MKRVRDIRPDIVSRGDIMGGQPCIAGTRIPAKTVAQLGLEESKRCWPYLPEACITAAMDWYLNSETPT